MLYGSVSKPEKRVQHRVVSSVVSSEPEPIRIDTTRFLGKNNLSLFTNNYYNKRIAEKTDMFYHSNNLQTRWLSDAGPAQLYYALIPILKNAEAYGLNPEDYNMEFMENAIHTLYEGEVADRLEVMALDVRITELYFLFTTHIKEGKIRNAGYSNKLWLREPLPESFADVESLAEVKDGKDLKRIVEQLQPANAQYALLKDALVHYRNLERYAVESLPEVNVTGKIEPGMKHRAIPLIRKRLSQVDLQVYPLQLDSVTGQWDSLLYDAGLVQGIVAFQTIHGLEPDGIIGPLTASCLNKSLRNRVETIAVNMDRLRWTFEPSQEGEYIIVNIPEYKLRVFAKRKEVFEMRVIVGSVENPTPVFNDNINHLVFSPTWTVPVSIIKNEIIPRLKNNPEYYTERNYVFYKNGEQVDPSSEAWDEAKPHQYRVVQQSGEDNSLGRVKFGMNNSMRIYLHDTPGQRLFAKDYRAFSHGCIRLHEPAKFAQYLLRENAGWDKDKIHQQMVNGKASTVILKKRYPVYIQYCTAWVSEDGKMNFRDDVYGHDRMQLQELKKTLVKTSGAMAEL